MSEQTTEERIAYACGFVESWLQSYAASIGVPTQQLTDRVGQLLYSPQNGEVLRSSNHLPTLRRKATKKYKVRKPKMEMDGSTRSETQKTTNQLKTSFHRNSIPVTCPVCKKEFKLGGLFPHLRHKHPTYNRKPRKINQMLKELKK